MVERDKKVSPSHDQVVLTLNGKVIVSCASRKCSSLIRNVGMSRFGFLAIAIFSRGFFGRVALVEITEIK